MSELQDTADKVMAGQYWEVFPPPGDNLKAVHRQLAQVLHPDRYHGSEEATATAAFAQLGVLLREAEEALAAGRYGEPLVLAVIRTRKLIHEVRGRLCAGDIADLYEARTTSDITLSSVIKVARSPKDNDLLAAEASALKRLHAEPDTLERHIPVLLDTFIYPEGRRRANAITPLTGFSTLEQVRQAHPDGVDPRHIAWMWRRLLMGLGFAHDRGIIHGAVLPPHVMIEPKDHAVVLVDWCYSSNYVDDAPAIKLIAKDWRHFYPEEVFAKESPSPATDLAMAAYTMTFLFGAMIPRPLRAFFKGCVLQKQQMRPQNAWILLKEFDALLERMGEPFYPRRWVEFTMPAR